ncbi:uncharacterized protein LOC107875339 isoform X2 [Capsicum annuum]|uniref:uncharacterized protein LOC107875339 isoform X2 n=1 Tax=Capsicum annuum TaxID=4072 RepID=UPI001FB18087|nr:uncharacterized protein LOC107875339 isoform X2 [Capsicum annuum]
MATTPSSSPPPPPPTLFLPPPDSTQPQISPSPQKKTQPIPWTHQETFNLIQAYQEKWYSLKKGQLKASQWEEVAITVAARCGFDEPSKSSTQCRHKIEKLRKRYRAERLKPYPNSWQYFDLMDSMERGPLPIAAHPVAMVECSNPNPNPNPNPSYSNSGNTDNHQRYYDTDSDEVDVSYMDLRKNKSKNINHIVRNGGVMGVNGNVNRMVKDRNFDDVMKGMMRNSMNVDKRKGYFGNVGINEDEDDVEEEVDEEEDEEDGDGSGGGSELAAEIRGFAERFMRMESKKIEMMKETERYRMEMEKRRMEMILETQRSLIDTINSVVGGSHKKVKPRSSCKELLGKMSSQQQRSKGKNVAGSSESRHKRSRYGDRVPPAPHIPRGQSRRYGTKAVMESGRKWYSQHKESKYSADQFIDRASLMKEYPSMVRRIEALHMNFLFEQPSECNLSLVREFYANWDLRNKDAEVEVRGRVVTFTANCVNDLLGTPVVDAEPLKRMNVEPPYQHIRHLLCGTCSTARWIRHKESGTHVSLPFAHMNREARLWAKIIYACLVHGTHMTAVTRDRVCIIYALMREDIELNVGAIIFSAMRKARLLGGRRYGFGGLLTRFLRQQGVPEEDVDYKPPVNLRPLDFSRTKGPASYGVTLTMPERQARNDEITARMYGLTMLQLKIGGRPATEQEIRAVELDYPLGPHARTMLRIGPDFDEPLDDDVPTEEERRMGYSDDESEEEEQSDDESDYESEEEEQSDDGDSGDDFGDDEGADDDMTALVPFD